MSQSLLEFGLFPAPGADVSQRELLHETQIDGFQDVLGTLHASISLPSCLHVSPHPLPLWVTFWHRCLCGDQWARSYDRLWAVFRVSLLSSAPGGQPVLASDLTFPPTEASQARPPFLQHVRPVARCQHCSRSSLLS